MLNIETIKYLVDYFSSAVSLMGKNETTVNLYRSNTYEWIKAGQLGYFEVIVVEQLIGMYNTDSLKWDITNKKLEEFNSVLDQVMPLGFDYVKVIEKLNEMKSKGCISEAVLKLFLIIYTPNGDSKIKRKQLITVKELNRIKKEKLEKELKEKREKAEKEKREKEKRKKDSHFVRFRDTYSTGYSCSSGGYGGSSYSSRSC